MRVVEGRRRVRERRCEDPGRQLPTRRSASSFPLVCTLLIRRKGVVSVQPSDLVDCLPSGGPRTMTLSPRSPSLSRLDFFRPLVDLLLLAATLHSYHVAHRRDPNAHRPRVRLALAPPHISSSRPDIVICSLAQLCQVLCVGRSMLFAQSRWNGAHRCVARCVVKMPRTGARRGFRRWRLIISFFRCADVVKTRMQVRWRARCLITAEGSQAGERRLTFPRRTA